jgi:periplasmic protein TonB
MVGGSVVAHFFMLGLAVVSPRFGSTQIDPSQVVSVDLVAMPAPSRAAAPPKPSATPPPPAAEKPPPPAPPKPKEVVLPKNPEREPSKPQPKPKQPEPEPDKNLEDLLADFRKEAGVTEPTEAPPAPQDTAAAPSPSPAGGSIAVSPEELAWIRKAKAHVRGTWVLPAGFRTEALRTHVIVELDASGAVMSEPRITKRSGNPWYDEGVVRAIRKASPLPPPPSAGEREFVFLPEDAL